MRSPLPARGAGRRALGAVVLAAVAAVAAVSCSGDEAAPPLDTFDTTGGTPGGTTGGTVGPGEGDGAPSETAVPYPLFADPAAPVCIGLSRRAGIVLPADPSAGERWRVTTAPDPAIAVPVGTEFASTSGDGPADVEVLSYAGRTLGSTAIEVALLGADGTPVGDGVPLRFAIEVTFTGACPEPPPPPPPDDTATTLEPDET